MADSGSFATAGTETPLTTAPAQDTRRKSEKNPDKVPPPGHGRLAARDYTGAERRPCPHPQHKAGDVCPLCQAGKLYSDKPKEQLRLVGHAPVSAICWDVEVLRCATCKAVFNAREPGSRYDVSAKTAIALSRYFLGLPFYRLDRFQRLVGVPLPDATQWDLMQALFRDLFPVFVSLVERSAQASLICHDDTGVRILTLIRENRRLPENARRGMHSSGFVTVVDGQRIVLYFSGRAHSGENLDKLLDLRESGRDQPVQMSDASSSNHATRHPDETLRSFCHAHSFRKFRDIDARFPDACAVILESLGEVFKIEQYCKAEGLDEQQRLAQHIEHSAPLLEKLKGWMLEQQHEKKNIEPNSELGKAMNYMLKRWDGFTLFLRQPGVPLDNNISERILKWLILQRKNSLFYANEYSAYVGSVITSVIMTAVLAGVNVFDYLNALQANHFQVGREPERWLPWNYPNPARPEQGPAPNPSPPLRPPASSPPPCGPDPGCRSTTAPAGRALTA